MVLNMKLQFIKPILVFLVIIRNFLIQKDLL